MLVKALSPLQIACKNGYLGVVTKLIESGADVNQAADYGCAPLHIACLMGQLDIVCKLLESGVKTNQVMLYVFTPFLIASVTGHFDISKKLLEHNAKNFYKQTNRFFSQKPIYKAAAVTATCAAVAASIYCLTKPQG